VSVATEKEAAAALVSRVMRDMVGRRWKASTKAERVAAGRKAAIARWAKRQKNGPK